MLNKSVKPAHTRCVFFNDEAACRKLRKDRNCYQCPITQCPSLKNVVFRLQGEIKKLNDENTKLKIILADKCLSEIYSGVEK